MTDLPLFGEPEQAPRERSLREQEKEAAVGWRKYTGRATPCERCTTLRAETGKGGITNATQTRHEGFNVQYLCGFHASEVKLQEELDLANSKRRPKEPPKAPRPMHQRPRHWRNKGRF